MAIMITNVLAVACKSNLFILKLIFDMFLDREILFLALFDWKGEKKIVHSKCLFYIFFVEMPYHCFNVVAFLLLLNWV